MAPDVVKVTALPDWKLQVEFADGAIREFDVKSLLQYPAFKDLRDASFFAKAKACNGTVAWNDQMDISPDTLYLRGYVVSEGLVVEELTSSTAA